VPTALAIALSLLMLALSPESSTGSTSPDNTVTPYNQTGPPPLCSPNQKC
jgi:hypothetical protein